VSFERKVQRRMARDAREPWPMLVYECRVAARKRIGSRYRYRNIGGGRVVLIGRKWGMSS
jgi:hypothetical protein